MIRIFIPVFLMFAVLSGLFCDTFIVLDTPTQFSKDIELIVAENPPPPGYTFTYKSLEGNEVGARISILRSKTLKPAKNDFSLKFIKSIYRLPIARFYESKDDISRKDIEDTSNDVSLLLGEKLPNGYKGLSVDGLYPFQPGYPLKENLFLKLDSTNRDIIEWFKNITIPKSNQQERILWLSFAGDIMLARGVDSLLLKTDIKRSKHDGINKVFHNTLKILKSSTLSMGNLECVASLKGKPLNKSYTFHFNPKALDALKNAGFDYVSLTNNHVFDYGVTAFADSLVNIKNSGLGFSGAGSDLNEASKPWIKKIDSIAGNIEIAVYSVGAYPTERTGFNGREYKAGINKPGILWADRYFLKLLKSKTSKKRIDIVMVHGGVEWTSMPTQEQRKLYRSFIDMGADIVIGSHPHFIQGMEQYNGGFIAYSLGNFIFPGMEETGFGDKSIILRIGLYNNRIIYIKPIPIELHGRSVYIANGLLRQRIINRFYKLTRELENETTDK